MKKLTTLLARFLISTPVNLFLWYGKILGGVLPSPLGEAVIFQKLTNKWSPTVSNKGFRFDARDKASEARGVRILEKEPDTIAWIQAEIDRGDVFYDVGANVGVFSVYAAKKRGAIVYAFEPEAKNYEVLNRNILLNNLGGQVVALCLALHNEDTVSTLHLSSLEAGRSQHSFLRKTNVYHETTTPIFPQGALGVRGDSLVDTFGLPLPNHLKIDVDGNEDLVVQGMKKLLTSTQVR